jgi:integrase
LPASFHGHDLRHRRVTTWLAKGKSPAILQEAMGRRHIKTTMDYMHLVRENPRELVEPQKRATQRG